MQKIRVQINKGAENNPKKQVQKTTQKIRVQKTTQKISGYRKQFKKWVQKTTEKIRVQKTTRKNNIKTVPEKTKAGAENKYRRQIQKTI